MFKLCSTQEVIENFMRVKPDSQIADLVSLIGIKNTVKIFKDKRFQGKQFYVKRISALWRMSKPVVIQKKLQGLQGDEREEMIGELSRFFNISKNLVLKMEKSNKYYRK